VQLALLVLRHFEVLLAAVFTLVDVGAPVLHDRLVFELCAHLLFSLSRLIVLEPGHHFGFSLAVFPHASLRLLLVFELVVALAVAFLVLHHALLYAVVIQVDAESLGLAVD